MAIVHSRHDMICWQSLRPATVASRLTRNVANFLPACYSVAHKYIICYSFVFLPLNLSRKGTRGRGRHARTHAPCVADRSGRNASFQLLSDYGRNRARWENIRGKKRVREEERNERRKRKTKKKKEKTETRRERCIVDLARIITICDDFSGVWHGGAKATSSK